MSEYCRITAAFEEFKEILDEIHMAEDTRAMWKSFLDERARVYKWPRRNVDIRQKLERLIELQGVESYRIEETITGELVIYIRPKRVISHIDLSNEIKNEGNKFV